MENIKTMIEDLSKSKNNKFGSAFYQQHILLNERFSHRLADHLGADKEVLSLAAYLHDIAAISDYNTLADHHLIGAQRAGHILESKGCYSPVTIRKVQKCIETHSNPVAEGEASKEEICFSNADAMTQIVNPVYWLYYAYNVKGLSYEEGRQWYYTRVTTHWNKLIEPAKKMIEAEYHSVIEMLLRS